MRRTRTIAIFAALMLLLSAKVGLHLWQPTTQQIAAARATDPASVAATDPKAEPAVTNRPSFSTAELRNAPLTTLAQYLIPVANAEANTTEQAIIEDKTLASLRQYKQELDQRASDLDKRAAALKAAEEKLQQRITELEQLEASIQQRIQDEAKIKSKKIKRLTAVYEGMKPDKAAAVIAQMELATVVKIFLLMDEKKVGKILSFLPPEKAVTISQALTRQISTVK